MITTRVGRKITCRENSSRINRLSTRGTRDAGTFMTRSGAVCIAFFAFCFNPKRSFAVRAPAGPALMKIRVDVRVYTRRYTRATSCYGKSLAGIILIE